MIVFVIWYAMTQWAVAAPVALPVCEPPPKKTVTVPCEPDEGCVEKWIFVPRDMPNS